MDIEQFRPQHIVAKVEDVSAQWLEQSKIEYLLLDVDNTITGWCQEIVEPTVDLWLRDMLGAGIRIMLISNSGSNRLKRISDKYDIPYISWAMKPAGFAFTKALKQLRCKDLTKAIVIGDQIFTDIYGGNRLGLKTILVTPRYNREFFYTKFMRFLEKFVMKKLQFEKKQI